MKIPLLNTDLLNNENTSVISPNCCMYFMQSDAIVCGDSVFWPCFCCVVLNVLSIFAMGKTASCFTLFTLDVL